MAAKDVPGVSGGLEVAQGANHHPLDPAAFVNNTTMAVAPMLWGGAVLGFRRLDLGNSGPEVILMRSTVLILGLSGNLGKKETEFNERIAEKEKEGWEVVDMQISPPAFGDASKIILRLARELN